MAVGFGSLEIARSGMFVNERGLFVTGHNMANVNTEGYSRQQAMITTGLWHTDPSKYGLMQLGLGADIQGIRQIRDSFLDNIYRNEVTNLGYWQARSKTYEDIQAILGEPMSQGLQTVINDFWDSWQELSKAPESLTVRALVRQRGEALVEQINHIGTQIDKLQEDLNTEIEVRISEINDITRNIAKLNLKILEIEASADKANDYKDQRNNLLDRLSKLIDVDVIENPDGQVDITVGGYFLVAKGTNKNIIPSDNGLNGLFCVPVLEGTKIEIPIKSGTLKGLMEARGEVPGLKGSLVDGSPNDKADIVFAIDVSDTSAEYLANVQASIGKYVDELDKKGLDYNLRLITYGSTASANVNYGNNAAAFVAAVGALTTDGGESGNDFSAVVTEISSITDFRQNANKYAVVFTAESVDGDEIASSDSDIQVYADTLANAGVKTSIVTNQAYYSGGSPVGETSGWEIITNTTGGNLYNINLFDYDELMTSINTDINNDVNIEMSLISQSNNILVDLKKQLNAQINILLREINYFQRSGKTMEVAPDYGQDFFVPINSAYPLELGNVMLNPNLSNLNNIVASKDGSIGDNVIALAIGNLRMSSLFSLNDGTVNADEYYQTIILSIGIGGSEAARICENQQKMVNNADNQRKSIAAVSMDEEMANMMKYKYAYNASAKVISVIDEMLESIISRLGIMGR